MKVLDIQLALLLLLTSLTSFAQKETNIWYFGKNAGLDFNFDPPKILLNGALITHEGSSVISDKNGTLLFYTNGETVWNKNHDIMENGTELGGNISSRQSAVIVPKPNEENLYYIFTMDAKMGNFKKGLRYSIVNLDANNGLGQVTEKGTVLHEPGLESLSVAGNCKEANESEYWVLAANNDKPGKIYAYKVDKNGINKTPVISSLSYSGELSYIKFSPASNKVAIINQTPVEGENILVLLADFDYSSGILYNVSSIKVQRTVHYNQVEFSPNGKLLYISNGKSINQIDLTSPFYPFIASIEVNKNIIGDFQIGPDGNIYISKYSNSDPPATYLSVIKNPNEVELSDKYIEEYIDLKGRETGLGLPNFVRSFLYNGFTTNAGTDTMTCSGHPIKIGSKAESGVNYQWHPSTHLNRNDIAEPTFTFNNTSNDIQEFEYILTASDEICSRKDTVKLKVYPAIPERILGSKSVCPGVTGVVYSVPPKKFQEWHWEVEGGAITEGQGTNNILVDWGKSNPEAKVRLKTTSTTGCDNVDLEFPVRVNVELDTETPQGQHEVCYNLRQDVPYFVTNTNGSVYTWELTGGSIKSGQGTHMVLVDWDEIGRHKIWVNEESITIDTVCYGMSDIFDVLVYKDSTEISIDYVSVNLEDESYATIQANEHSFLKVQGDFAVYRRGYGADDWTFIDEVSKEKFVLIDGPLDSDNLSFEYKISTQNPCNEEISSSPHRTILLHGDAQNENDGIFLEWNGYDAWPQGVGKYEIWRRIDHEEEYRLIDQTSSKVLNYSIENGGDGFTHFFRIKAIDSEGMFISWSNEISLTFEHKVSIPNVFTPNGDGKNETFFITKLEMYPDNELTVFNRWGKVVYFKRGYGNEWNGENMAPGVYFYALKIERVARQYKGWVQILK